jgi:fibronectin type 3 domain-containing protein
MTANLQVADGNTGPALSGSGYMPTVLTQLQELKALGVQAIMVQVGFPVLYEPFYGSAAALAPYTAFYSQVAQAVRAAGLKLIVENDVLLSSDIETGWTNLVSFYSTLSWTQYEAARATMAATVAETMLPDYLVLGEEPDGEAKQTGQTNMNIALDAAQLIAGSISAVRASTHPSVKLGAGFGSWLGATPPNGLADYVAAYVALPLDYIDFHIYPINTEVQASFIDNTLLIASLSAAAGKPVAISEAWEWKMENSEWGVLNGQNYRGRDPFSFWAPLDAYFLQTLQALAKYTNMLYMAPEGPDYLFTYQTFGGTSANGGAANCTCTTTYCDSYNIIHTETQLANTANNTAVYSTTGFSYDSQLVEPPDKTPPSAPSGLTGTASYTLINLTWQPSTDNVGVAGYNVYRCSPPAQGQSCTGVYIADTTEPAFNDSGLLESVPYNYQVQAFDLANNHSALSPVLSLLTFRSPPNAPSNLTATVVSAQEVDLSWSPPQSNAGLGKYLIFKGSTPSSMVQIGTVGSTTTTFRAMSLSPSIAYYFGVEAVEYGVNSPMSPAAWATTMALPNAPSSVTAVPSSGTVALTWQENIAYNGLPISNYQVYQGTSPSQLTQIATVTGLKFTSQSLASKTTYYYQIVAVDTGHDSSPRSTEVHATTP